MKTLIIKRLYFVKRKPSLPIKSAFNLCRNQITGKIKVYPLVVQSTENSGDDLFGPGYSTWEPCVYLDGIWFGEICHVICKWTTRHRYAGIQLGGPLSGARARDKLTLFSRQKGGCFNSMIVCGLARFVRQVTSTYRCRVCLRVPVGACDEGRRKKSFADSTCFRVAR